MRMRFPNLLKRWKESLKYLSGNKTGEIWEELIDFQIQEDEMPKQYLSRFKQLESKIKNARTTILPQYLGYHFLLRANLDHLTIQSIMAMANLESDEEVLKHIQNKYELIVMEQKDKAAFYGTGYRAKS